MHTFMHAYVCVCVCGEYYECMHLQAFVNALGSYVG